MELHNKLIMAEHDKYGIWYFTNRKKIEWALEIFQGSIDWFMRKAALKGENTWKVRDWTFSWVDDSDNIIYKYINPERKDIFGD